MMAIFRKTRIFLLVLICCLAGCAAHPPALPGDSVPDDAPLPPFSTPVTCEEVRHAFYRYSAPAIVKKLMENDLANWRMIMNKISEGDAEWILCAALYIKPGAHEGASEEFMYALAYALRHNPETVLSLEQGVMGISLSEVCSWPFVEPEYDFVEEYGEKALAALRKVDDPGLRESRDICMDRLQSGLDFLRKEYREGDGRSIDRPFHKKQLFRVLVSRSAHLWITH